MAALNLSKVSARILWVCGKCDGPNDGIAEYDGDLYWFRSLGGSRIRRKPRTYALYPLDEDECKTEILAHKAYQLLVGHQLDVDTTGAYGKNHIYANVGLKIYNKLVLPHIQQYRAEHNYVSRQPVGYFTAFTSYAPPVGLAQRLARRVFDKIFS